ncbi:MAG: SIR2 family protein [Gemmatimonadaceae bacterium]
MAFIGAGLSIPMSDEWAKLVEGLAAKCGVKAGTDLYATVDDCLDADPSACDEFMRERFPFVHTINRTALGLVARLPFKSLLTTNFDAWLWLQSEREDFVEVLIYPQITLTGGLAKRIFYLHGQFDEQRDTRTSDLVFGKRSFEAAYSPGSILPGFLLDVFTFLNVVFVGFTPTETYISEILRRSNQIHRQIEATGRKITVKRYSLEPDWKDTSPEWKAHQVKLRALSDLSIEPCLYDPVAADRRGLDRLLYGWLQLGDLKKRAPAFAEPFAAHAP